MQPAAKQIKAHPMMANLAREVAKLSRIINGTRYITGGRAEVRTDGIRLFGSGGGGATVFPAKVTWSAGDSAYNWIEQDVNPSTGALQDRSNGLSSTGAASGSQDQELALEFGGIDDLPDDTVVVMLKVTGTNPSNGAKSTEWRFTVPHETTGTRDELLPATPEASDSAQSDTWDIEAQTSNEGVEIDLITRVYYDHTAGTPVLYGFQRTLEFDAGGRLMSISAETRYTIDQPDTC